MTQQSYDNHLIFKSFVFQFANSYTSLFYLAFVKGMLQLCAPHTYVIIGRVPLFGQVEACSPSCVYELTLQLASLLATNITVGQIQELFIPYHVCLCCFFVAVFDALCRRILVTMTFPRWVKTKILLYLETRNPRVAARAPSRVDTEEMRQKFEEMYDEYIELAIQFGYVMLYPMFCMFVSVHAKPNRFGACAVGDISFLRHLP